MSYGKLGPYIIYNFALVLLVFTAFAAFRWLGVPAGQFIDWAVGVVSFWWLLAIVTVPWNVHFQARETMAQGVYSLRRGLEVVDREVAYVGRVARWSLAAAVALHLLSAAGLYALARFGVSPVGYVASGAALLLTLLRPSVRAYEYLRARLADIRREFLYPREDVLELRKHVSTLEHRLVSLELHTNPVTPGSWAAEQKQLLKATRDELTRLAAEHRAHVAESVAEHERLSRATEHAVAQLSTDGKFLEHARELVRFFKEA